MSLSAKQTKALGALLDGSTVAQAAQLANVSKRQVFRWLANDKAFTAELRTAESAAVKAAGRRLVALTTQALDTLEELMECGNFPGSNVRRLAAADVLTQAQRWRAMDLEDRLAALETEVFGESQT